MAKNMQNLTHKDYELVQLKQQRAKSARDLDDLDQKIEDLEAEIGSLREPAANGDRRDSATSIRNDKAWADYRNDVESAWRKDATQSGSQSLKSWHEPLGKKYV